MRFRGLQLESDKVRVLDATSDFRIALKYEVFAILTALKKRRDILRVHVNRGFDVVVMLKYR